VVILSDIVEQEKQGATMIRDYVNRTHLLRITLMLGAIACGSAISTERAMARNGAPPPPPVYNWTGFYVGAYVGGGWGHNPWSNPTDGFLGNTNLSGFIGSLQGGYNWQFGNVVTGIELSAGLSTIDGDFEARRWNFAGKVRGIETATGRLGFTAGPGANTLWYVKGGAAWAQYKFTTDWPEIDTHFESNKTLSGWTIGAGLEHRVTSNVSLVLEYKHYDFGSGRIDLIPDRPIRPYPVDINNWRIDSVTVGINYNFSQPMR
jgi:outer membrane immunogenic protein